MAVDYNLYYNAELDGEQLIEKAARTFNLNFEKIPRQKVMEFDLSTIGVYVYILNYSETKCKIKSGDYLFRKSITFAQHKGFGDASVRRKALLKIILNLMEKFITGAVFLCNGEIILLLKEKESTLKIKAEDGFFDHGVSEILDGYNYQCEYYNEADFMPYL